MGQREEKLTSLEGRHNHRKLYGSCVSQHRNKDVLENITLVATRCIQKFWTKKDKNIIYVYFKPTPYAFISKPEWDRDLRKKHLCSHL